MYFILSQLDQRVLLLEILFHFHILDMVVQGLAEGDGLMQKARYALGFLMPCVQISRASQFTFMNNCVIVYPISCLIPSILYRELLCIFISLVNYISCPLYCYCKPSAFASLSSKLNSIQIKEL